MEGGEDPFAKGWREVEAAWGDDAAHRRFIALCNGLGALGEAGRRYRSVLDTDPSRRVAAQRWIDAIVAAAMEQMALSRTAPEVSRRPARVMAFLVAAAVLALSCWALLRAVSR